MAKSQPRDFSRLRYVPNPESRSELRQRLPNCLGREPFSIRFLEFETHTRS
jgi:hypothetical protein